MLVTFGTLGAQGLSGGPHLGEIIRSLLSSSCFEFGHRPKKIQEVEFLFLFWLRDGRIGKAFSILLVIFTA